MNRAPGVEVEAEIAEVAAALAGNDLPGEGFLAKLGRLNMARLQAEERVLSERVLVTPETPDEEAPGPVFSSGWVPMVEDPTHPFWQEEAVRLADREE